MSFVYLEKQAGSGVYRCRGQLADGDDFESFKTKMAAKGFDSFTSDVHQGREIEITVNEDGEESVNVVEV